MSKYINADELRRLVENEIAEMIADAGMDVKEDLTTSTLRFAIESGARRTLALMDKNECKADVREVKHGEWIFKAGKEIDDDLYFDTIKECSVCKFKMINNSIKYPYCPNCGADMRGEDNE